MFFYESILRYLLAASPIEASNEHQQHIYIEK